MWRGYLGRIVSRLLREAVEDAWKWLCPTLPRKTFGHFLARYKFPYGASEPLVLPSRKVWEMHKVSEIPMNAHRLSQCVILTHGGFMGNS